MCVNNLPRVVTWSGAAGTRICDLSDASPTPLRHYATHNALLMHIMHQVNDRPDCIIHRIEVCWVRWPHVWRYGLSFSNVCMRLEFINIDELRQRLLHVWRGLEQSLIDDAVDQWRMRLHACVRASGGHFEHTLWLSICFLRTSTQLNSILLEMAARKLNIKIQLLR